MEEAPGKSFLSLTTTNRCGSHYLFGSGERLNLGIGLPPNDEHLSAMEEVGATALPWRNWDGRKRVSARNPKRRGRMGYSEVYA
jgi:hypothetical protein